MPAPSELNRRATVEEAQYTVWKRRGKETEEKQRNRKTKVYSGLLRFTPLEIILELIRDRRLTRRRIW